MKLMVIHEITIDESKLVKEYSVEAANDYRRMLAGQNLDSEAFPGYTKEAIKNLAHDAILGKRNHGTDIGEVKITVNVLV
jgi:hypothetical protein